MEIVTGFAMIVGLLQGFKSERSSSDLKEFLEWLKEKHHEDVIKSIQGNQKLSLQLSEILSANHKELIEKLNHLDLLISSVAGRINQLSGLAKAIHQESIISEQAFSILEQFVSSGAMEMMELKVYGGPIFYLMGGGEENQLQYHNTRLLEDDLNTLLEYGFLRLELASKGSRKFFLTNNAVNLIGESA